jgi:signal transduction histidine kinase
MDAVSRLAGGAAHGFNNLLTIITGYSQLLRSGLSESDPLSMYVDEISAAADRAAALTGKLLAFSRRRLGEPERVDVNALVAETVDRMGPELPPEIEVSVDLAPGLAPVFADRRYLEQSIRDLVANSREAMPRGGRITIRTAGVSVAEAGTAEAPGLRPGPYVLLTVEDTGEGIDPETQKHLFEPFFTTKGVGKGTGLATAYGTVRQYGGDIRVSSRPGQGTSVAMYLPAAQ